MLRSVGAVLAGFVLAAVVVLAGVGIAAAALADPEGGATPSYLAANLLVSFGAAVVGGMVAAWLGARRPVLHAAGVAALMVALSLPGLASPAPGQPAWYPATVMVLGAAGALAGGWLTARRRPGARAADPRAPSRGRS